MLSVEIAMDANQIDALQAAFLSLPKEVAQYAHRELRPFVSQAVDRTLRIEPPTPFAQAGGKMPYIRWTSERQRRFVMAKLRREGNLPYQRTRRYVQGWHVVGDYTEGLTSIVVYNDWEGAVYVGGDRQQGFHQDTGWPNANSVMQVISIDLSERIEVGLPIVIDQALGMVV